MIEVVMGVHDVFDRLVGNELADFRNHRERTFLVERRLDHRDKVTELDCKAVVSATGDEPHAVRQLLRRRTHRRRRCALDLRRHRHRRHGDVRLDVAQRDLHRVMRCHQPGVALVDVQHRRVLHTAVILVVEVTQLVPVSYTHLTLPTIYSV